MECPTRPSGYLNQTQTTSAATGRHIYVIRRLKIAKKIGDLRTAADKKFIFWHSHCELVN